MYVQVTHCRPFTIQYGRTKSKKLRGRYRSPVVSLINTYQRVHGRRRTVDGGKKETAKLENQCTGRTTTTE